MKSEEWKSYPLWTALKERRSRRVSIGMSVPGGPLKYASQKAPEPLSEVEQAILCFAGAGLTGPALNDWDWQPGRGGNVMAGLVGRTVSSSDAIQSVSLIVIDDSGAHLVRRPTELEVDEVRDLIMLGRDDRLVEYYRKCKVRIADSRCQPPVESPYNLTGNQWSLHASGTTYFLAVADTTFLYINVLLEMLNEEMAIFPVDDRRLYLPAGIGKYAKSRGGHLCDSPGEMRTFPVEFAERVIAETLALEVGMMMQNLGLTAQALGLSGFPHYTSHDSAWFEALNFDMRSMPASKYFGMPRATRLALKARRQDPAISYPVGLTRDGTVLLRSYCPPNFDSMEDAVNAVVDLKFGPDGIYRGKIEQSGWKNPDEVAPGLPQISEKAVAATVSYCSYLEARYGRFPAFLPPFHTTLGFQAGHLDIDFYDRFYDSSALSETHRSHAERCQ